MLAHFKPEGTLLPNLQNPIPLVECRILTLQIVVFRPGDFTHMGVKLCKEWHDLNARRTIPVAADRQKGHSLGPMYEEQRSAQKSSGGSSLKIEAVIVCKDYSDFLEHTLPENTQHLDNIVVVTHPDDVKTHAICNRNSVRFVTTNCFDEKGHVFNKGQAINVGLDNIRGEDWVLHLDADIVLCKDFRRLIDHAQLNTRKIYGADRINVYGFEAWQDLKPLIGHQYQDRWFIDPGFCHRKSVPEGIRLGARVIHHEYGWLPIGFFQLFHVSQGKRYNYTRGSAAGTDCMFPAQWSRDNRVLLPEIVVYHLDSEMDHKIGTNWKGRKSAPFAARKVESK